MSELLLPRKSVTTEGGESFEQGQEAVREDFLTSIVDLPSCGLATDLWATCSSM
jgi:hypothetical protein